MKISVISFTPAGNGLSRKIAALLPEETVSQYARAAGFLSYDTVGDFAARAMARADALIFVGAAGIAVRAIAPYIRGKDVDPAVLVLDQNGRYVIPILSGHLGGANALAQRLAEGLGAEPVLTTATDTQGVFAADSWAAAHGCAVREIGEIRHISGALLRGETVGLASDFPVDGALPAGVEPRGTGERGIILTIHAGAERPFTHTLTLVPRIVHIGVGCRRNTEPEKLTGWVRELLRGLKIDPRAVSSVSSIDLKADEKAIHALAESLRVPARFYTARELEAAPGSFPASDFVKKITGTDNVCQRSAALASAGGICLLEKTARDGMTVSVYREDWRVRF